MCQRGTEMKVQTSLKSKQESQLTSANDMEKCGLPFLSKIGWMPREIHRLRPHTDQPNARKSANLETETTQAYPPPYVKVRKLPNEVAIDLERETREAEGG